MKVHIKWEYNLKGHFLAYGKVKFKTLQISEYCNNFIAWPMPPYFKISIGFEFCFG